MCMKSFHGSISDNALFLAGGAVLSEGYQMMVNDSVEQSKSVADKYIELCKAKDVSILRCFPGVLRSPDREFQRDEYSCYGVYHFPAFTTYDDR